MKELYPVAYPELLLVFGNPYMRRILLKDISSTFFK
jgi:hypothetical protein